MPPSPVLQNAEIHLSKANHRQIYVGGRYHKLRRHISHTPWIIGGKRLCDDSVEDLIAIHLSGAFKNDGHKFASSGREDADVLMLGDGRPFYFELTNPKVVDMNATELDNIQMRINETSAGKVLVERLQIISRFVF